MHNKHSYAFYPVLIVCMLFDRAWVPVSQVYLLSKEPPTQVKNRKGGFDNSVDEVEQHIEKIR